MLRVAFRAWYDRELDEFEAETVFLSPERPGGERSMFGRRQKQAVGFPVSPCAQDRTTGGNIGAGKPAGRAPSRKTREASVLGVRSQGSARRRLGNRGRQRVGTGAGCDRGEDRQPYAALWIGRPARLLADWTPDTPSSAADHDVFSGERRFGSSASIWTDWEAARRNVLVFALLGAIGDVKDNVVFAMEEPEIALPPHTQRVVIKRPQGDFAASDCDQPLSLRRRAVPTGRVGRGSEI